MDKFYMNLVAVKDSRRDQNTVKIIEFQGIYIS